MSNANKVRWVCNVCGYVHEGSEPPSECPQCGADSDQFEREEDEEPPTGEVSVRWVCNVCGYVYDPEVGDPSNGIAPGTAFEALSDNWCCPECGVGKDQFTAVV